MADLDDFFAKKDRKKSKGTKKFATTEEVAKKLEDGAKRAEKPAKKERPAEGEEGGAQAHEQDEWKEFEEEKKDYTGLKIGNLTIGSSGDPGSNQQDPGSTEQQGYESGTDGDRKAGPWKRIEAEEKPEPTPPPVVAPAPVAPPQNTGPTAYVPPSLRNQQQQPQHQMPSRLRSKVAPDITNEEFFPTLSGSKGERSRNRNEGSFEVVAHNKSTSHRHAEQTKATSGAGPRLSIGNRFNTLDNDS